jgi:hypothetical protein
MYGVYRVTKRGQHVYVPRTATSNRKLAEEIAADFTEGRVTLPTGEVKAIIPRPCIAKEIRS